MGGILKPSVLTAVGATLLALFALNRVPALAPVKNALGL